MNLLEEALEFQNKHGYWTPHPDHPVGDWRSEVLNDDTRQGYWQWVNDRIEQMMHQSEKESET